MQFSPQVVEVKPGDTIVWENRDMFVHNVTAAAAGVGSGDLAPGKTWRYVVRAGTSFDYLCTLHPVMKGRVERRPSVAIQPSSPRRRGPNLHDNPGAEPFSESTDRGLCAISQ